MTEKKEFTKNFQSGLLLGGQVAFFALIFVLGRWVAPIVVQIFSRFKITEPVVTAALIILLSFAWGADFFGVSGIIGTYFAGIALARTEWSHQIEEKISPIAYGIFVPFFFINIGLPISFEGVGEQIWFIVVFCIIAVVSKWIGCGLWARLTGFNTRSSIGIGAGMISRGEVALILASMGLGAGLLPQSHYTSIIIVVIFSTLITPPFLKILYGNARNTQLNLLKKVQCTLHCTFFGVSLKVLPFELLSLLCYMLSII